MTLELNTLFENFENEARKFSGHFGLAAQRLDTNAPILYYANDVFPTASIIKLVVLTEYFAQIAAGELAPDQQIVVKAEDMVGGSGVLKDLQPGLQLSLHDLATLAITVSDNTAANLLIRQLGGLARVNARLKSLGMYNTVMGRAFVFDSNADNTGTPADFLRLLLLLAKHQLISSTASRQILDIMRRQQYMEYIPRYLPYHPFAAEYDLPQTITIANKVGMLRGTVNDAAIITTPSFSYALVIFSRNCQDTRPAPDNEGALLVARLSRQIYNHFLSAI